MIYWQERRGKNACLLPDLPGKSESAEDGHMKELLSGLSIILLYAGVLAAAAVALRIFLPIRDEVYRKMLHMIMVIATMFWPYLFEHW